MYGGLLTSHKGINLPGSKVSLESLSKKDLGDLRCVLKEKVDFVALSFVRSKQELQLLRRHIDAAGSDVSVIAKIERPEAVDELSGILEAADAIMVARGDLGVELGPEAVPAAQKRIIARCLEERKPVITATQMLESMVTNPRPTRAEASDVANAIYDGTSAVMLSAETAMGKHPVRVVRTMDQIVRRSEADIFDTWEYVRRRRRQGGRSVTLATVRAAAYAALEADVAAIAVFTESGRTAQLLAAERIPTRIFAFTPFQRTVQRLSLTWGISAHKVSRARTSHEMTLEGERILLDQGCAKRGERVVVVSGTVRQTGLTNTVNIRILG
jgi:pyruvate kinase